MEPEALSQTIRQKLQRFWEYGAPTPLVLSLRGQRSPSFDRISALADGLSGGLEPLRAAGLPLLVLVTEDMAKALGQALLCRLPAPRKLLCMDGLDAGTGAYLDIGSPVGSALPVVVKTLLFDR